MIERLTRGCFLIIPSLRSRSFARFSSIVHTELILIVRPLVRVALEIRKTRQKRAKDRRARAGINKVGRGRGGGVTNNQGQQVGASIYGEARARVALYR